MNGQLVNPHNVKHGLRASSRSRATPETEKPPAKPVDIYYKQSILLKYQGKRLEEMIQ